jgi:hypothetical protein
MKTNILIFLGLILLIIPGCKQIQWELEEPAEVNTNTLITLTGPDDNENHGLMANGASTFTMIAEIPPDYTQKTITFKATSGTFPNGSDTYSIDAEKEEEKDNLIARAVYTSGIKEGGVTVTASISDFSDSVSFTLERAYPEKLEVEASIAYAKLDGSIMPVIKATLTRNQGLVSIGAKVEFYAFQVNLQNREIEVGRFLNKENSSSNEKGVAVITFAADTRDVIPNREIKILVKTKKNAASYLEEIFWLYAIE